MEVLSLSLAIQHRDQGLTPSPSMNLSVSMPYSTVHNDSLKALMIVLTPSTFTMYFFPLHATEPFCFFFLAPSLFFVPGLRW